MYPCLGENVSSFLNRKLQVTVLALARDFCPDQDYKLLDSFHPLTKCFKCSTLNEVFTSTSASFEILTVMLIRIQFFRDVTLF
jgi:hypothetical protein